MLILISLGIIITISYLVLLLALITGWKRIKTPEEGSLNPLPVFVSVLIAAKNEEKNILSALASLSNQTIDSELFEVVIIDDFSTDNTNKIVSTFCEQQTNFKLITLNKHKGKKFALDYGIKNAKGNLIVTTDADCTFQTEWLQTICNYYLNNNVKMIIAPVLFQSANWFEHLQALDFFSLMISGAAATGINKPIMNNGANLAFSREVYLSLNDPTKQEISSGDDIFLLLEMKKEFSDKIHFLKSKKAAVFTQPQKTLSAYINQRQRWASKSKYYRNFDIIYTAVTVLSINLFLLFALLSVTLSMKFFFVFIAVFIIKSVFDFVFLAKTSAFFQQKYLLKYFLPVQLANIFLVPFLAFSGLFTKTKWKE